MKKTEQSFNSTLKKVSDKRQAAIDNGECDYCGMSKTELRCVSRKKAGQMREEAKLSLAMKEECDFKCQFCGADYSGMPGNLGKHEIVFRSAGGDPLSKENTIILCWINFTSKPFTLGCHQLAQQGLITKEQLLKIKTSTDK